MLISRTSFWVSVGLFVGLSMSSLIGCLHWNIPPPESSYPSAEEPADERPESSETSSSDSSESNGVNPVVLSPGGDVEENTVVRVTQVQAAEDKPYPKQDMLFVNNSLWPENLQPYPEPRKDALTPFDLWSTHYRVHVSRVDPGGVPVKNLQGDVLTTLSAKDWCFAALEGTAYVVNDVEPTASGSEAAGVVYNYAGRGPERQTDCSPWMFRFKKSLVKAMETTRFSEVKAPFGTGGKGWWLVPFRSIAVDRQLIPLGSVVYIPSVRGQTVVLPDGRVWSHDGYFLAADTGGAIKKKHIDLYTGFYPDNPFPELEASQPGELVEAYVVDDAVIQQELIAQHKPQR